MRWICKVCSYTYNESKGDLGNDVPPGTAFEDLPDDWVCPICGAAKDAFDPVDEPEDHSGAETTVSDVIVAELERWGAEIVLGMPGTSSLGLVDAVRRSTELRYVPVRHEANGAMAASAYNKLTGKLAVCLTIAGPGASNLATGLYDAKQDSASVLSLNGQVNFQYSGPGGSQEIDQDAFFKPICVFNNTIYDKTMTVKLLTMALKHATVMGGVSQLSVPNNIQREPLDAKGARHEMCLTDRLIHPEESLIQKAADVMNAAERPVVVAGRGAYYVAEEVAELAERLKAPIVTTWRAKGMLPDDHPWLLGVHGGVGPPQAISAVAGSDLLIALGVGFSDKTAIPWGKRMVQVDIDPLKIGKHPYEVALRGNCEAVLPRLLPLVAERKDNGREEELAAMKSEWEETLRKEASVKPSPLWPPYIMDVLSRLLPEDAVISIDVGDNGWWFGRNFRMSGQSFVMSGYLGTMGFGFPGALAAKLAYPDRPVVCITGDGGFQMAMADFPTAVEERLPVTVVLLNNRELAMIRQEQAAEGLPNFATGLRNADYASYAEGCGGKGFRVERPEDLEPSLLKALESDVPSIVDISTDPRRFERMRG